MARANFSSSGSTRGADDDEIADTTGLLEAEDMHLLERATLIDENVNRLVLFSEKSSKFLILLISSKNLHNCKTY